MAHTTGSQRLRLLLLAALLLLATLKPAAAAPPLPPAALPAPVSWLPFNVAGTLVDAVASPGPTTAGQTDARPAFVPRFLSLDPGAVTNGSQAVQSSRRVLLVSQDVAGPVINGGIGTAIRNLAYVLAAANHNVTVLFAIMPASMKGSTKTWTEWQARSREAVRACLTLTTLRLPVPREWRTRPCVMEVHADTRRTGRVQGARRHAGGNPLSAHVRIRGRLGGREALVRGVRLDQGARGAV